MLPTGFRGDIAAASLKPVIERMASNPSVEFPRRYRRGLIEAPAVAPRDPDRSRCFRGDIAAASLKQRLLRDRSTDHGGFRGDIAAASLKQGTRDDLDSIRERFRGDIAA